MAYVELIGAIYCGVLAAIYYGVLAALVSPMDNLASKLFCKAVPIVLCALLAADALSRLGYLK